MLQNAYSNNKSINIKRVTFCECVEDYAKIPKQYHGNIYNYKVNISRQPTNLRNNLLTSKKLDP